MAQPLYSNHQQIRRISQMALERLKTIPRQRLFWKCDEDDPRKHNESHLGLFYSLPEEEKLVQMCGYASPFKGGATKLYKLWGRMNIMVRQPALSAMDKLKKLESPDQSAKLFFYGDKGHGKSHTLVHLLHYLHLDREHFIIPIKDLKKFCRGLREFTASTSRPGRIDTPLDAALLLQQIRTVNADLFEKYNDTLLCSQDYHWSIREITKAGEPIVKIAEHGVNRVNHASDCLAAMSKELMLAADEGKIRLATITNELRWLYQYEVGDNYKHADFRKIVVDDITVARAIKKLIKNSGKGAIVLASSHDDPLKMTQNLTPGEILGEEGVEALDGCTEIHVPKYSKEEFENCLNYYQDIGWFARPEARTQEFRDELRFISGLNPGHVEYLCQAV